MTIALEFRFNGAGEIESIYTPARPRKVKAGYAMAAWEGHFAQYEMRQGMRVPLRGEVGWYAYGSWAPVWRGRIVSASYSFCP